MAKHSEEKLRFKDAFGSQFNDLLRKLVGRGYKSDESDEINTVAVEAPHALLHYNKILNNEKSIQIFQQQMEVVKGHEIFMETLAENSKLSAKMTAYATIIHVLHSEELIEKPKLQIDNIGRLEEAQKALGAAYEVVRAAARLTTPPRRGSDSYFAKARRAEMREEHSVTTSRLVSDPVVSEAGSNSSRSWQRAVRSELEPDDVMQSLNGALEEARADRYKAHREELAARVEELRGTSRKGFGSKVKDTFKSAASPFFS